MYTNLLKVGSLPDRLYVANTTHRFPQDVWSQLRSAGGDVGPEWSLGGRRLVSFRDLRQHPWPAVCDRGTVEEFDTRGWADADDPDQRRDFVQLLNLCLRGLAESLGLRYSKLLRGYYFPATSDLEPRTLGYRSLQQNASRDVFSVYHKKGQPGVVSHYRHSAFCGSFSRFDSDWYLVVNPTYLYTADGHMPSHYHGELLAGIKRFDRNAAVLGQLVMWGEYLAPGAELFSTAYPFLRLGKPERLRVDRGIDDDTWARRDDTPTEAGTAADDSSWPGDA